MHTSDPFEQADRNRGCGLVRFWLRRKGADGRKQIVEDLAHKSWIKARKTYRPQKGRQWWGWLALVTETTVIDYLKKEARWGKLQLRAPGGEDRTVNTLLGREQSPYQLCEKKDLIEHLMERVSAVLSSYEPGEHAQIYIARKLLDMPAPWVADIYNTSVARIHQVVYMVNKALSKGLGGE